MEKSVDVILSSTWNGLFGQVEKSIPEHMWVACRVLSAAGFVKGNRESVAALEIGPFRIATVAEYEDFLENLLKNVVPSILRMFCSGLTLKNAVGGVLVTLFSMVRTVANCSVRISDPKEWTVLLHIKSENQKGHLPSEEEVLGVLTSNNLISAEDVKEAIERLSVVKSIAGGEDVYLIVPHLNGRLECRA